jgi:hypothetical protein
MRFELKPLSFGEVLDGSFKIYRSNVGLFLGIALVFNVPVTAISAWIRVAQHGLPPGQLPPGFGIWMVLLMAGSVLVWGVETAAAVQVVLGEPTSLGKAVRRFMAVIGATFIASILMAVIGMLCTLALVIPGIIYFLRRGLYLPVLLVEGGSGPASLKRSKVLVRGTRGGRMDRVFGVSLVFGALSWALVGGLGILIPASVKMTYVGSLLSLLPHLLLAPLFPISMVLIYFDARVRDEGYDLELRAQEAAKAAKAANAASAAAEAASVATTARPA